MKSHLRGNPTDTIHKPTLEIVVYFEKKDILNGKPLESILAMELLTLCHKYSHLDGSYLYQVEVDYGCSEAIIRSKIPTVIKGASTMDPKIENLSIPVLMPEFVLRLTRIF